jgi:drug/metabolite transporter (DMT)-like permease
LVLVAVCSSWGSIPLVVRHVDLPATALVFARVALAAAGLGGVLALQRGGAGPALFSYRPVRCLATAALLAGHWVAFIAAYQRAPVGTVILIVYLAPVGVAALAPRMLGEEVGTRTWAALALALTGFLLVVRHTTGGASASGLVLAGIASASFVVLMIVSKPLAEAYGGLRLAFMELAGATVVLAPVAATAAWGPPRATWGWLLVLGLGHTALGLGLYLRALGRIPATQVAILGYFEPASAVVCGWLFLSETPRPLALVGGVLILVAGALVVAPARPVEVVGVPR